MSSNAKSTSAQTLSGFDHEVRAMPPMPLGKRVFDIAGALIGMVLALPFGLLIAGLLWLEAPGEVLFAQRRLGRGGRPFMLYKFRKLPASWGDRGPGVTVAGDARMTRIGAVLERTKLDELPQLWNILKGEMSFVGPRPESYRFEHLFRCEYRELLHYRPGIFGPAQIAYRNEGAMYPSDEDPEAFYARELFPAKARLDLDYYRRRSGAGDIGWVVNGVWTSVVGAVPWQRIVSRHGVLLIADLLLIALAWLLANLLRFRGLPHLADDWQALWYGLLVLPPVLVLGLLLAGCYRYPKAHFSYADAVRLTLTVACVWPLAFLMLLGLARHVSLYLVPTGALLLVPALLAPRIWLRLRAGQRDRRQRRRAPQVVVYGPGAGGIALANWIRSGALNTSLLGFLDDDANSAGQLIHGIRVLGSERDIPTIDKISHIDEIWLTFRPDEEKRARLYRLCDQLGTRLVTLPDQEPFVRHYLSSSNG